MTLYADQGTAQQSINDDNVVWAPSIQYEINSTVSQLMKTKTGKADGLPAKQYKTASRLKQGLFNFINIFQNARANTTGNIYNKCSIDRLMRIIWILFG